MSSSVKKILLLTVSLVLLLGLTGCQRADYVAAVEVYNSGDFLQAKQMFLALEDYEDSAALAKRCDYHLAVQMYEAGNFRGAIAAMEKLGDYEDCKALITHSNYQIALQLKQDRNYDAAQAAFEALEGYENSEDHIQDIRWDRMIHSLLAFDGLENDGVRISVDPEDPCVLRFSTYCTQEEGYVLYDTLELTLRYRSDQVAYAASSKFSLSWMDDKYGNVQSCSGTVAAEDLTAQTVLPLNHFQKVITNLQGEKSTVTDPADSTMADAMAENLKKLLETVPGMLLELDPRFTMDLLNLPQLA